MNKQMFRSSEPWHVPLSDLTIEGVVLNEVDRPDAEFGYTGEYCLKEQIRVLSKLAQVMASLLTQGQQIKLAASLGYEPVVEVFDGTAPQP